MDATVHSAILEVNLVFINDLFCFILCRIVCQLHLELFKYILTEIGFESFVMK